jgi:hypothetical protein
VPDFTFHYNDRVGWFPFRYEFENCGSGRDHEESNSKIVAPPIASGAGKINPMMLLRRNAAKSMKQQVMEFRHQYLIIQ